MKGTPRVQARAGPVATLDTSDHDLQWFLGPLPVVSFLKDYYERRVWHGRTPVMPVLHFTRADFETLLWMNDDSSTMKVVGERAVERDEARTGERHRAWVLQRYQAGHTIVLHAVDRHSGPVATIQRILETSFGGRGQVDAYFTPPATRGFKPHYHTHDTFILQNEGTQRWRLYETPGAAPLRNWMEEIEPASLRRGRDVMLGPGEVLYVPRGTVHAAENRGDASLHLTFTLRPHRWIDVLHELFKSWERRHLGARKSVPLTAEARAKDTTLVDLLSAVLAECRKGRAIEEAFERVAERTIVGLRPPPGSGLVDPERKGALHVDHFVARRVGMPCVTAHSKDGARLAFPGLGNEAAIVGPTFLAPTFRFIARARAPFKISSLPGGLTDAAKLTVVRNLISKGLLRRCHRADDRRVAP